MAGESVVDAVKGKANEVMGMMTMMVQGAYYDSQAEKLGVDPTSPTAEKDIERRLKAIQDMSVEDYMAVNAPSGTGGTGSLGVNAVRKQNQERALADLLDFYARKNELKKAKAK